MARGPKIGGLQGLALWVPITVLLSLGLLTTLIDFTKLSDKEGKRAQTEQQRFLVNAASGEVLLGTNEPEKVKAPDIAPKAEEPAPAAETPKPPETIPAGEETKTAEPEATKDNAKPVPSTDSKPAETPPAKPAEAPSPDAKTEAPAAPVDAVSTTDQATPEAVALPQGTPTLRTAPLAPKLSAPEHGKNSLVPAPAPEVSETIDGISLPKRGDKSVTPSKLYAHPFKRKEKQAILSFVVLNTGLDPQSIGLILGLPEEVSVAYSPYVHPESSYSENLRAAGHEVWTMLPAMSDHYPSDDPGPLGIIGRMPSEESLRRLHVILSVVPGSIGLVLPPDEAISLQKETLAPVLNELYARGLLLLSTHPTRSVDQISRDASFTDLIRRADLVLDPTPNELQIRSKLASVLESAKEKGQYTVVLSARPQSLKILGEWLKETKFDEDTLALAPLSAIYESVTKEAPVAPAPIDNEEAKKSKKPNAKSKPKVLPQDQYRTPPTKDGKPAEGSH